MTWLTSCGWLDGRAPWFWLAAVAVAAGGALLVMAFLLRRKGRGCPGSVGMPVSTPRNRTAGRDAPYGTARASAAPPTTSVADAAALLARLRRLSSRLEILASPPPPRAGDYPLKSADPAVEYVYKATD